MIPQLKNIKITIYEKNIINHEIILERIGSMRSCQSFKKVRKYTPRKIKERVGHYFHLATFTEFIITFDMTKFYWFYLVNFCYLFIFSIFLMTVFFFFFFFFFLSCLRHWRYFYIKIRALTSKSFKNIFLEVWCFWDREDKSIHASKKIP